MFVHYPQSAQFFIPCVCPFNVDRQCWVGANEFLWSSFNHCEISRCCSKSIWYPDTNFCQCSFVFWHGTGLFGHCEAYYGMVEAQGRGTLHCHMLIWISGNLPPQEPRDRVVADQAFKDDMFRWLEDSIHCELLGMSVQSISPRDVTWSEKSENEIDPCTERQPHVREMDGEMFQSEFIHMVKRLVIECNWHVHNDTCFKYLRPREPRTDSTCWMRIHGETWSQTGIDEESQ